MLQKIKQYFCRHKKVAYSYRHVIIIEGLEGFKRIKTCRSCNKILEMKVVTNDNRN